MKNILIVGLVLMAIVLASCEEDEDIQTGGGGNFSTCDIDSMLLVNKEWTHVTGALATLRFESNGVYFENATNDGNWFFSNGCDSIYVYRPSNNFYYRIESLTSDTLVLRNPVLGFVTYYYE